MLSFFEQPKTGQPSERAQSSLRAYAQASQMLKELVDKIAADTAYYLVPPIAVSLQVLSKSVDNFNAKRQNQTGAIQTQHVSELHR
jgi:hypothetical protein